MGLSVGPASGGNVLIAGDAGGAINPFNGEGIAYGYETGRLAAAALGHALTGGGPGRARPTTSASSAPPTGPTTRWPGRSCISSRIPRPCALCVSLGMRSELLMNSLLRIMANLMRPDASGPAEVGYRALELVSRLLPDSGGLENPAA